MSSARWFGKIILGAVTPLLSFSISACDPSNLPLGDAPGGAAGQTGLGGSGGSEQGAGGTGAVTGAQCAPIPCPAPGFDPDTCQCRTPLKPGACDPLAPLTTGVALDASKIVDAGGAADGTVYVLTEEAASIRLFVGTRAALAEVFEAGTGQGTTSGTQFWTFQYAAADGTQVTVEVQRDSSGTRMGVAKGPIPGKGFDVGSTGEVLEPITAAVAAAVPAETTQTYHVEFAGTEVSGPPFVVVIVRDHAASFDGFRLFLGGASALVEQPASVMVSRGLSIPSQTTITFTTGGLPATLTYGSASGTLTIGNDTESLSGSENPTVPAGAMFVCP